MNIAFFAAKIILSETFLSAKTMNIVILGPGAIGSLWAYHLKQAGHQVSLWSRNKETSISLSFDKKPTLLLENRNMAQLKQADLILITVKAWQVKKALLPLIPYLNTDTILVFMHNGMGAVDSISDNLTDFPVLLATTSHGALLHSTCNISHTGHGKTVIGGINAKGSRCDFLADIFQHALPAVEWEKNISLALWNKLVINCAINPLTAIYQCKNGDLALPKYSKTLTNIIDEIHHVMLSEKVDVTKEKLTENIYSVIRATAENLSSMNQDIHFNRPTEIEFITGYLIKRAHFHNVAVPENEKLYNQIKDIEQNKKTNITG